MKKEPCYLQDFGYERFETIVGMIGGKWKLRIIYPNLPKKLYTCDL